MVKNPPASAGDIKDTGSIPGLERPPGEGNGNPLQFSCLENPWTEEPGGLWGYKESDRTGQISMHTGYIVTRKTSATPQLDQNLDKLLLIISL